MRRFRCHSMNVSRSGHASRGPVHGIDGLLLLRRTEGGVVDDRKVLELGRACPFIEEFHTGG